METALSLIDNLSTHTFSIYSLILVLVSIVFCFAGMKIMKGSITAVAFLCGLILGATVATGFTQKTWVAVLSAIIGGIILALLAFKLYKFGEFCLVAMLGFLCIINQFGSNWWAIVLGTVIGICLGLICFRLNRPAVIICTSLTCSLMIGMELTGWIPSLTQQFVPYVFAAVFAIIGITLQFITTHKKKIPSTLIRNTADLEATDIPVPPPITPQPPLEYLEVRDRYDPNEN